MRSYVLLHTFDPTLTPIVILLPFSIALPKPASLVKCPRVTRIDCLTSAWSGDNSIRLDLPQLVPLAHPNAEDSASFSPFSTLFIRLFESGLGLPMASALDK